ncbi:MAG: hypothetical protein PWQ16_801, partial [bacterium]|nr:hypothetical protein [bacterium]
MSRLILIPHLGSGGAERVAVNLFRALGFEGVITFENRVAYDLPSEKVECIESPASDSLTKKFLNFPVRFWKIRAIKKKFGSRLTLSFLEPANLFNVLTKSSTERVVLSFRGHYSNDISHSPFWGRGITKYLVVFLYKIAFRLFYNRADLMVAVSHSARKDLVENFHLDPRKIEVIYNPVFLDEVVSRSGEGLGEHEILFKFPT